MKSTVAQILQAISTPGERPSWSRVECGVVCLIEDSSMHSYFLRLYCVKVKRTSLLLTFTPPTQTGTYAERAQCFQHGTARGSLKCFLYFEVSFSNNRKAHPDGCACAFPRATLTTPLILKHSVPSYCGSRKCTFHSSTLQRVLSSTLSPQM